MNFLKNEQLNLIREDWPGNPHNGREFQYLRDPFLPSWRKLLQWQLGENPQKKAKKADLWRPEVHSDSGFLSSKEDFVVWLGHASFLIQLEGLRLLTDPVFFDLPFLRRFVHLPFPVEDIREIDYILLSHDHRDHCDKKSIQTLLKNNQPKKILAPLKMNTVIGNWVGNTPIEEAGWYQTYRIHHPNLDITYLPARHWSRRGLTDFNRVLWGSFMIRSANKTIYFAADSGPGRHFEEIGNLFPDIDLAFIGIGAYSPSMMMEEIHTSPAQAFEAFRQLGARKLIPMHYGTYDLSDEPISEPYRHIHKLFREAERPEKLTAPAIGEAVYL